MIVFAFGVETDRSVEVCAHIDDRENSAQDQSTEHCFQALPIHHSIKPKNKNLKL
jgi:hypothetical protein